MITFLAVFAVTFGVSVALLVSIGRLYGTVCLETSPRRAVVHLADREHVAASEARLALLDHVPGSGELHELTMRSDKRGEDLHERAA